MPDWGMRHDGMTDRRGKWGSLTSIEPAWSLLLQAARGLTGRGVSPFSRDQLLREVQRLDPSRRDSSLGPVLQGLTANAPGGVPSPVGRPLLRVGRGQYRLVEAGETPVPVSGAPMPTAAPTPLPAAVGADIGADPTVPDVVLVGCVKTKGVRPAAARDLFTSPLFARRRQYAQQLGRPWFVLSAKHALVEPNELLAPYDVYLPEQSPAYRTAWGAWVVERLVALIGPLQGRLVEVHAGSAYIEPLRGPLTSHGARLHAPLAGLAMGEQLAWYDRVDRPPAVATSPPARPTAVADVEGLVQALLQVQEALAPAVLAAMRRPQWQGSGLYSWWVDEPGATDLTAGLGHPVPAGLIYAGQAGATRWPSGRRSSNTLHGRLVGMHLGTRAQFSTFRRTLGAALRVPLDLAGPDDERLSVWMQQHLRAVVVSVADGDELGRLEQTVLDRLDPPLNLQGRPPTPLRAALSELRRKWS
ncbi:MAG: DUF6884 domain-containing protein [Actinomycetes bacterium]